MPAVAVAAGEPPDQEMVATLIRRTPGNQSRRALLYVHGWNDYFFQTHHADFWAGIGFDFYAIDLRRYGRSLRSGQLHGFITNLDDYAAELDAALEVISADHDQVLLMGHSTGGLVATLWAAQHQDQLVGLVLNSPWLDLQGSAVVRALGTPVIQALGSSRPTSFLKLPDAGLYKRAMHLSHGGEWDYDLELKTSPSPPLRAGWLRAILQGHQRVAAGLDLQIPVLAMCSTKTDFRRRWHEDIRSVDNVLDVDQIASRAALLGRHVTIVRIDRGVHDLVLSAPEVREQVFAEMRRWVGAYLDAPE
nr:alpha/beta hydrolase [Microlunatus panaciterrae]